METNTLRPFVSEEWFLQEKLDIDAILSPVVDGKISIEEWSAKAIKIIKQHIADDPRTIFERANSRDDFGLMLLDLMRKVESFEIISRELNKAFGVDIDPLQYVDIAKRKFINEYDLYLKRNYLVYFSDNLAYILAEHHDKNINEQFLIFLSSCKNSCVELGIGIEEFKFAIDFTNDFFPRSAAIKAKHILEKRREHVSN